MLVTNHLKNHPTHYLKSSTLCVSLKIWRHYLYGAQFQVFSDHTRLPYLFDRWMKRPGESGGTCVRGGPQ
ncbi:hypothetical protein KC217_24085, partial [Mycobacterium tuberculosis]|nr:hypothetical protein [Mycobacterium tuberculosis]